jgi:magnesium transporter
MAAGRGEDGNPVSDPGMEPARAGEAASPAGEACETPQQDAPGAPAAEAAPPAAGQPEKKKRRPRPRKNTPPVGASPGTLIIPEGSPKPEICVIRYTQTEFREEIVHDLEGVRRAFARPGHVWVDIQGLGDAWLLMGIGQLFSLHALSLEDILHIPQRPKKETFEKHEFFVSRMIRCFASADLDVEQISIFWGERFVLTFQERPGGDVLDPVRVRLRQGRGRMRGMGPDYLAYAIIDAIVDGYYPVLERLGSELEDLEEAVIHSRGSELLSSIQRTKNSLLTLRRAVWPQRDAVNGLLRDDSPWVSDTVKLYLRDTYDHCVQAADVIETYREISGGLLNTYLSVIANRTNEIMRVLTIMSTIFIPLTFVVGLYGMNFRHMPELDWPWAYPLLLALMLGTGLGMVLYFRRRGWIGKGREF